MDRDFNLHFKLVQIKLCLQKMHKFFHVRIQSHAAN